MPIKQVTVTGTVQSAPGVGVTGYATWIPSAELVTKAGAVVHSTTAITVPITSGAMSALIWANNDPGLASTTSYWVVSIFDSNHNLIHQGGYVVPFSATTIDLSALAVVTLPGQQAPVGTYLAPLLGTATAHGTLGLPVVAGAPTGTPSQGAGCACFDTVNNKIWVYTSGGWKGAVVS